MTVALRGLRFSDRDRRALVMGFRLATPALVYAFAVKPYVASVREVKNRLESQSELLTRENALVAQAPFIPRLISAARVVDSFGRQRMYSSLDAVIATDALSRDVARAFETAAVSLQHLETRESLLTRDGLRELAIDIRAEGDFEGILTALASLEANERLVRITRISIDGGARLTMVATIRGYMQ